MKNTARSRDNFGAICSVLLMAWHQIVNSHEYRPEMARKHSQENRIRAENLLKFCIGDNAIGAVEARLLQLLLQGFNSFFSFF